MTNWNGHLLSSISPSAFTIAPNRNSGKPPQNPITHNLRHSRLFNLQCRSHPIIYCSLSRRSHLVIRNSSFASTSSSIGQQSSSVGVNPIPVSPPPSQVGSPLFWVGVGVGLSALFSWLATFLKKYAMQQAFKTMMNQMNTQNNQFSNSAFPSGSPFPFPMPSTPGSTTTPPSAFNFAQANESSPAPPSAASQNTVTVEIPATEVKVEPTSAVPKETQTEVEQKKYSFVDVSPEDSLPQRSSSKLDDITLTSSSNDISSFTEAVPQNGTMPSSNPFNQSSRKGTPLLSLDALEKMMEDPTVQKMVYPYLPEEMRNPTTFKWMLQNPQYRQQLEEMLANMSGNAEWDNRMVESLKNFDLSSPEVKQQFDQIGLSPEEVISKIMANPDVAMAFQNPRVQQAILECSQNPMNITKYQNDREVMDVFEKISELFPGVGSP